MIASGTSSPKNLYSGVLKDGENSHLKLLAVPFISQKKLYCSEASATMILHYYGKNKITQEYVHENISINFEKMLPPLTRYLDCSYEALRIEGLKREINEGDPIMIRLLIGEVRHTVVVVGYKTESVIIHDPERGKNLKMSYETLLNHWIPVNSGHMSITFN